ncbi:DUF3306 domain-containing protein [Hoeflea sp. YIM 152468]|uniref:DUF3306 domain-containing protein n=1 Tax=Hoeflea sp. YIM 152468 TaxID=3031759 RepID=UPI0023D97DF5|nr:DUF3306 domain-containing protein [Hoeflea sp. YIM 152468]MDF1606838.1 DUF3306 domain-containing protein [Hoeflea sp. YIM 152468]
MGEDKDGFLARWSRRKQAQQSNPDDDPDDDASVVEPDALDQEQHEAERAEAEANRLAAEAVELDEVEYGFDFSIFLKRGVPDLLRKKALRKFFNSSPVLANLDGLNDYDEDYNNPLHKVYKSTWDVARGFLTESEKILQQTTGRLTRDEPLAEVASADMPEDDTGDATETAAPIDEEPGADADCSDDTVTAMQNETDPVAQEPKADESPDAEPPQQKRVSIRQRMNG